MPAPKLMNLQLLDANGLDVTPRSLLTPGEMLRGSRRNIDLRPATSAADRVQTASRVTQNSELVPSRVLPDIDRSTLSHEAMAHEYRGMGDDAFAAGLCEIHTQHGEAVEVPLDSELNALVHIRLSETETFSLLDLPSLWVSSMDAAFTVASEDVERYKVLWLRIQDLLNAPALLC